MNKKALKVLEYNKIIDMLKAQASSQMAKERLAALLPETEIHRIRDERSCAGHSQERSTPARRDL